MNQRMFVCKTKTVVFLAVCLGMTIGESLSQNGPVTARMPTAKFALMKGWWGSDHNTSTPVNFPYMAKLIAANVATLDTFNLTNSTSPLSQVSLDKYDVVVWYNVYRMYEHIDTATGNRMQRWYEGGNKGLACFHQCVRSSTTSQGIPWTWWINMMGKDYNTYAAAGVTGPVYVDAEALSAIYGTQYTAGQSFSWSDEWYTYVGNPRGLPGTRMMWTTADSKFTGTFNSTMGEDHPLAWIRDFDGGRFALNGMYHTTVLATATGALKTFADSSFVGTMRFLAAYNGCKDSNYVEYNKKATHQVAGACVTPRGTSTFWIPDNASDKIKSDAFKIVFSQPGSHSVEIFNTRGSKMAGFRGEGSHEYSFGNILKPGIYYLQVHTASMKAPFTRRIVLL